MQNNHKFSGQEEALRLKVRQPERKWLWNLRGRKRLEQSNLKGPVTGLRDLKSVKSGSEVTLPLLEFYIQ